METNRYTKKRVSSLCYTILICSCFKPTVFAEVTVSCQPGWNVSAHSGTCVMLSHDEKSWAEAREDCKKHKADLVKIKGSAMNNFIMDLLKTESSPVFIGLQAFSGYYKWINENYMATYLNWAENGQYSHEECVKIETREDARGKWAIVDCDEKLKYLCERTSGPQSSLAPALCEREWILSASSETCIRNFYYPTLNWEDARQQCLSYEGDLVRIVDDAMKTLVIDQSKVKISDRHLQFWIGLSNRQKKDEFRWLDYEDKVNSSDWFTKRTGCAALNYKGRGAQWTARDCASRYSAICEARTKTGSERCESGFILQPFSTNCFLNIGEESNWDRARNLCKGHGADLATVADNATNQFIWDQLLFLDKKPYWIGLSDRKKKGEFRWLDEEKEATYTNWYNEQQNYHRCVVLQDSGLEDKWFPRNCSLNLEYMCEKLSGNKGCSGNCHGSDRSCYRDGKCIAGCRKGYWGDKCDKECETGKYGRKCEETCNTNCAGFDNQCNNIDGTCINGCDSGYKGKMCEKACDNHTYGLNCSHSCNPNCKEYACDEIHGFCIYGCDEGYKGVKCNDDIPEVKDERDHPTHIPEDPNEPLGDRAFIALGLACFLIAIIVVLFETDRLRPVLNQLVKCVFWRQIRRATRENAENAH